MALAAATAGLVGAGVLAAALAPEACDGLTAPDPAAPAVTRAVPAGLAAVGLDVTGVEAGLAAVRSVPVRAVTTVEPGTRIVGAGEGVFILVGTGLRAVETAGAAVASTRRADRAALTLPADPAAVIVDPVTREVALFDQDLALDRCGTAAPGAVVAADATYTLSAREGEVELRPVRPGRGWTVAVAGPVLDAAAAPSIAVLVHPDVLEALDVRTGARRWRVPRPGGDGRVLVAGDDLVIVADGGRLVALDAADGAVRVVVELGDDVVDVAGVDRHLLVQTRGGVSRVDATGTVLASARLPGRGAGIAVSDGYVAVALEGPRGAAVVLAGPVAGS